MGYVLTQIQTTAEGFNKGVQPLNPLAYPLKRLPVYTINDTNIHFVCVNSRSKTGVILKQFHNIISNLYCCRRAVNVSRTY